MLEDAEDDRDVECEFLDHGYFVGQVWEAFFHHPPHFYFKIEEQSITKWHKMTPRSETILSPQGPGPF